MKTNKQKKSGFTLVELMVVAIIVAILAAVAIPLMSGNKERAAATEAQAAISTIWTAERTHYAEYNTYTNLAAGSVHNIRGINDNDLDGKYFDHDTYSANLAGTTLTIAAAASRTGAGLSAGTGNAVQLQINTTDNTSTWGGYLLD